MFSGGGLAPRVPKAEVRLLGPVDAVRAGRGCRSAHTAVPPCTGLPPVDTPVPPPVQPAAAITSTAAARRLPPTTSISLPCSGWICLPL